MNNTARGYSTLFLRKIEEADPDLPVIQFATECVRRELPITEVAKKLGVTRATVYNWFTGKAEPRAAQQLKMSRLLARWQRA